GAVEAPGLGPRDHRGRVDRGRAGELHRHRVDPVLGEGLDARPPFEERRPGRGDISTDGRRRAEPGDDDTYPVFTHVELLADRGAGRPAAPRGVSGARRPPPVEPGGTARAPADAAPLTAPADDPEPTSGEIRTG